MLMIMVIKMMVVVVVVVIMIPSTTVETTSYLVRQNITCGLYFVMIGSYYCTTTSLRFPELVGVLCSVKRNISYRNHACPPVRPCVRDLVLATSFS